MLIQKVNIKITSQYKLRIIHGHHQPHEIHTYSCNKRETAPSQTVKDIRCEHEKKYMTH